MTKGYSPCRHILLTLSLLILPCSGNFKPRTMVHIHWWNLPPYVQNSASQNASHQLQSSPFINDTDVGVTHDQNFTGIFPAIIQTVLSECFTLDDLCIAEDSALPHTCNFTFLPYPENHCKNAQSLFHRTTNQPTLDNQQLRICLPVWERVNNPLKREPLGSPTMMFLPLIEVPGAVHFYERPAQPVASDLMTVIIQGWPMLVLILLGAGYSGIIIWLLVSEYCSTGKAIFNVF